MENSSTSESDLEVECDYNCTSEEREHESNTDPSTDSADSYNPTDNCDIVPYDESDVHLSDNSDIGHQAS